MAHSPYVTRLASRLEKILCAKTDKKLGSRIEKDKKGTIIRETNEERIAPMHEGRWFSWKERGRTLRCVCVWREGRGHRYAVILQSFHTPGLIILWSMKCVHKKAAIFWRVSLDSGKYINIKYVMSIYKQRTTRIMRLKKNYEKITLHYILLSWLSSSLLLLLLSSSLLLSLLLSSLLAKDIW